MSGSNSGWTTLVDGTRGLDNFDRVGEANWTATEGAIQATRGGDMPAYLVTRQSYGKWNTYEITMRGNHLVLLLNGQKTVDVQDAKFASGPLALQWGRGTIKFRKVEIRAL